MTIAPQAEHLATARKPMQARSRKRFEAILKESDQLLSTEGLHGFSIPVVAENLGYNRRTIYALFPSPFAILNELTRRHVQALELELAEQQADLKSRPETTITQYICTACNYHNRHPAGRLLILGGAVSDQGFRAQELTAHRLGRLCALLIRASGIILPKAPPDIPVVAVELAVACMRVSFANHAHVSHAYAVEAAFAMLTYLAAWIPEIGRVDRARIEQVTAQLFTKTI